MKKLHLSLHICLLSAITLLTTSCNGQLDSKKPSNDQPINNSAKIDKIDEIVKLYASYEGFNGSILVSHEGEVIYKNGFGMANFQWEIPNQADTKFMIGSITKQFTAMLIMQLVAENKLDLNTPIINYLPNYPEENGKQITLHHLLTHSSGLGRDSSKDEKKYMKPVDMVNQFAALPLEFQPGESFSYSNAGYTLLGYIIENVTGNSYEEELKKRIFEPLQMKNSGFYRHRPIIKNMSSGYNKNWGEYFNIDYSDESSAYAAGAIYSTVEDMFLWDQALYNEDLLPKKYLDKMFTKYIEPDFGGYYGYGWELVKKPVGNSSEMVETIGHSGTIDGYCALQTRIPSTNSSIVLLNNTRRAFLNAITTAITGILNDKPYDYPLKPLAKFMAETIQSDGIESGIAFYREHKDNPDYYVSEKEIIIEGYRLLHSGKTKEAEAVFKLSTEVFPYRDNPCDSYAEALMELGKNEAAIKNYKKSLLLNPDNKNAISMLKKLTGKEIQEISLLKTDSSWGKEVFIFPLRFARNINYNGFEEAHFPKGWSSVESPEFWSYAFVWAVDKTENLSEKELENNLQAYFDGLMKSVNKEKGKTLPQTKVNIKKTSGKNEDSKYTGTVLIYDSFITRKPLLLNVKIEKQDWKNKQKSLIIFKFSPKAYDNSLWKTLDKIKVNEEVKLLF